MTQKRRYNRAFTMIELLIAIAIIALLAAISIPRFVTARYRAYLSACLSNEKNLATALESYRTDNHDYPSSITALVVSGGAGHINALPTCPSIPTTGYTYEVAPDGQYFTLVCPGYHHFQVAHQNPGYPQYTASGGLEENGP